MLPLPGLYNALNALAAVAASIELGLAPAIARATLEQFSAAFGRIERIDAGGKPLFMALIKNPVGASETVRMLTQELGAGGWGLEAEHVAFRSQKSAFSIQHSELRAKLSELKTQNSLHVLIAINDRHADGTDVSWLWDADFERLGGQVAHAVVAGTRAEDMAVRLKYAGLAAEQITVEPHLAAALDTAVERPFQRAKPCTHCPPTPPCSNYAPNWSSAAGRGHFGRIEGVIMRNS